MELIITDTVKDDIRFFLKSGQSSLVKKIEKLLVSIKQTPYAGIGKPESLKYEYSGKWSRPTPFHQLFHFVSLYIRVRKRTNTPMQERTAIENQNILSQ